VQTALEHDPLSGHVFGFPFSAVDAATSSSFFGLMATVYA